MAKPLAVLIVEDSDSDAQLILRLLDKAGYSVTYEQVDTSDGMRAALEKQTWDIVISDYSLPQFNAPAALKLLHDRGPDIPFLVVSGTIGEETAVAMMKSGAHDYLVKGNLIRLVPAIERELDQARVRRENKQIQEDMQAIDKRFRALIENSTDAITLLDAKGKAVYDSPAAPGMLGYGPEDWIGKDAFKLMHPDDLQKNQEMYQELLKTPGAHQDTIFRVRHKNGSWLWIEATATNLLEEPSVNAVVLNYRDISGRIKAEEALRESESIFRGFLEQSEDAIMLADEQGLLIQWSNGAEKLTGYSRDESVGRPIWDVQFRSTPEETKSPETYELIKTSLQAVLHTGHGKAVNHLIEATIQRPNGSRAITQTLAFSVRTEKGFLLGSILRDVTERKQAEETIRASEERFRTLYENNTLGIYRTTPGGRILLANPSLVKMLGFTSFDELYSRNLLREGYEPSHERVQFLELIERQGHVQGLESAWERKDGSFIFVRESARAIRDREGKTLYYDGTVEDITERKNALDALRASEARYKGLFEDLPIAIWEEDFSAVKLRLDSLRSEGITDLRKYLGQHPEALAEFATLIKPVDVNKAAIKLLGAHEKKDLFEALPGILINEPKQELQKELINIWEGKTSFDWEAANKTLDGGLITVEFRWSVAPGYETSLSKVILSMVDITQRKQAEEARHDSEVRYKSLFEDSPIALWEEDFSAVKKRLDALRGEGITNFQEYFTSHPEVADDCAVLVKVLDVNKATVKLLGANNKEDLFKGLANLLKDEPQQEFQKELINIAAGKTSFGWEGKNRTLDGRQIDIDLRWSATPGYENSLSKVIISMSDITERKQAEEKLTAERDLLNTLVNTLPDSIFIKDAQGRIIMDNDAHRRTLGANTLEQVVGKTDFDFHPRERAAQYDADEKQVIQSGKPLIDKMEPHIDKENNQRWLLTTKVPFRDRQGTITGIVGFNHDITEIKKMEEELMIERNLLRTLIDNLPDVVYVKDIEGRFIIKNLLDARQMGASSPEETIGKTDFDYYSPELAAQYFADDQVVFHSGQPIVNREEPIVDATGRSGWVLTTKVPLRDLQGKVTGLVGIGHDITERKQAEERIQRQLQHLAALRAIDQVITSSFDLHNSLTVILKHVTKELGVDAADVLMLTRRISIPGIQRRGSVSAAKPQRKPACAWVTAMPGV